MEETAFILDVDRIDSFYGEAHVLHGVDLKIRRGETVAVLGRNGAGKTTLLRSILGLTPAKSGTITFRGQPITHRPTNEIANLGIGWVPDNRRIFPTLSVQQNLEIARKKGPDGSTAWDLKRVYDHFPALLKLAGRKGETLSGGEQQMLSIARTLMGNPNLLLLDEPSEGLAPLIVREVMNIIRELAATHLTTVLVEQNSKLALRVCTRVSVLDDGRNVYEGQPGELLEDTLLRHKLLGIS
jgi:branched-chain amino acid transport system ATP-binding protein